MKAIKHLLLLCNSNRGNFAVRLRQACEDMGPLFVKFGQLLSTRIDLLPNDIAEELSKLQDQVPPFCGKQAEKIVTEALGTPINQLFKNFATIPLASASIAQVHAATLLDGKEVVVKILRPNIKKQVLRNLNILLASARIAQLCWPRSRRFKPHAMLLEIKKSVLAELDLTREAANASQLRRNFSNSSLLYVPAIYWSHTKHNILTMERVHGIQVSDIKQLTAQGTNLKLLAERGVEIFFTQVFRDCFFHADMHPGNVWVATDTPHNPKYIALDFGIVGTLSPRDQHYLAENLLAFFRRDYRRIAQLHIESGWVPKTVRVDEFEAEVRCVCEPIFEKPLKEISFGNTLLRLLQTAHKFDMQLQPQLILLQKTLVSVEGLGRQLYPDLDLWQTAKPFLENWQLRRIRSKALDWLEKLPELPQLIARVLQPPLPQPAVIIPSVWYHFILGGLTATLIIWLTVYFVK